MSLKFFHLVFVTAAAVVSVAFALWTLDAYFTRNDTSYLFLGLVSFLIGVVLIIYGFKVRKKLKSVSES